MDPYECCELCPRACRVDRAHGERGVCNAPAEVMVARAALHEWEEPPISVGAGSGTIFFSHCSLRCAYCQNAPIAHGGVGRAVSLEELAGMMLRLQGEGAANINVVTPTHYAPSIREAVRLARTRGLGLPIVWNTSGYETSSSIEENHGIADVYLTDFKYADSERASRYSAAPDYPEVAACALREMVEAVGAPRFDGFAGDQRMTHGVVVRVLLLPDGLDDAKEVVGRVYGEFGNSVVFSLMSQYTPPQLVARANGMPENQRKRLERLPELTRAVTREEYEELLDFADGLGAEDYFWQEGGAATESFIPDFLTGEGSV